MREHVLAGGVEHAERDVRDNRREIAVMHRVDFGAVVADAGSAEFERIGRLYDAIDVLASHQIAGLRIVTP